MKYTNQTQAIKIVGLKTKTGGEKAFQDIPVHWEKFFSEKIIDTIPNKISKDIYGIYTDFENEGENNKGSYSFVIGVEVSDFDNISEGLEKIIIPESEYQVFPAGNKPEQIGEKWREIWEYDFKKQKTYFLEYEKYYENGNIDIFIGIKS